MKDIHTIFKKTIFLQTSYQPTPHLETELEIMEQLLEQENIIYWIICKGDFKVCFHNPEHLILECKNCFTRVSNSYNLLKKKVTNHENLHLLNYNQFIKFSEFENNYISLFNSNNINDLKKFYYKSYDSGLATFSSLVSFTRNHEPNLENYKDFINKGLITGAYLYDTFQSILLKINPDLVILFNGRFIENRPLLRVCQEHKINYATHERGGKLNNYLFRINSIPHSLETISKEIEFLWKNAIDDKQKIGETFYQNRIKRVEDSWYSFTKEQQEGRLPDSLKENTNKKVITIFNSSLDEYEGLEGFGPYFYENDNQGILSICESLQNFDNIKLYLRVHPNLKDFDNSQNYFIENLRSKFPSLEIIGAQDRVDTYALINNSDIIIVFGSTVGVEAAFAGKNVVLLGQAAYQDLKCFLIPKNHYDLISILTNPKFVFPDINHDDTLKYGYWNEKFGIEYKNYKPKTLNDGLYKGKKIEISWFQKKKNKIEISIERKKRKYLGFIFNK